MKRLLILLVLLTVLSACHTGAEIGANVQKAVLPEKTPGLQADPPAAGAAAATSVKMDAAAFSSIIIKDIPEDAQTEYTDASLIKEFCSFLENQKYTRIKKMTGESYRAEVFDLTGKCMLALTFNDSAVSFDHDITIGKVSLERGTYEADALPWTGFPSYLEQLSMGVVMDPEYIEYPAKIKIAHENCTLQLVDEGNERINKYDVYPMLYDFADTCLKGGELEIVSCKKEYNYETIQSEADRTKKESRCILITFITSDTHLEITSRNTYKAFAMGYCLTLAKIPNEPGIYKLITDRMVLNVRADGDFDARFEALFENNGKTYKAAAPNEIKRLFDAKKPYYMEYICKNLGVSEWSGMEPDRLEIKQMKLNSRSRPYTVVNIYNPFDLRMLVYKPNDDNTLSFIGNIGFGGHVAGTDYWLEKAGNRIWVAGNACRGYGTGVSLYYREWYVVNDKGINLVLSYPYDLHEDGPYGGYSLTAGKVLIGDNKEGLKIKVNYDVARRYNLFLDISDEYGTVEIKGVKTAEFEWREEREKFLSSYAADETGAFEIPANCPEITRKCDELLLKNYEQILKNISALTREEIEQDRKAQSFKFFLNDCTDGVEKAELLKKLAEICPDI